MKTLTPHLLKVVLGSVIFTLSTFPANGFSQNLGIKSFCNKLETALNNKEKANFASLLSEEIYKNFYSSYQDLIENFPNSKWEINPLEQRKKESFTVEIIITGQNTQGKNQYLLESKQLLRLNLKNNIVIKKELISEYSIVKSKNNAITMTFNIPNSVLTGSIYDIDVILDKPLGDEILAGGIINVQNDLNTKILNKNIPLMPLASGGLFKTAQAPLETGKQKWAVLLAHPEGIISIFKTVKIVSN